MKIHHLNCISSCPLGGYLMDGMSPSALQRGHLCCHCLLIETGTDLVLVDTGFGLRDVADPPSRLSEFFLAMNSPDFREEMTAIRQVQALGFDPRDVRHIVLSHLDFDHAGGLDDFPWATVHLMEPERKAAEAQSTWLDRQRFRPQQWSYREQWKTYAPASGEKWFGFERVQPLEGLPPEIALVPLIGHTLGHAGIAVQRDGKWLLQAADAYFYYGEMDLRDPRCTPGLSFYQRLMEKDREARITNQARLRRLIGAHGGEVDVICAHDVREFERWAKRPADSPAPRVRSGLRAVETSPTVARGESSP